MKVRSIWILSVLMLAAQFLTAGRGLCSGGNAWDHVCCMASDGHEDRKGCCSSPKPPETPSNSVCQCGNSHPTAVLPALAHPPERDPTGYQPILDHGLPADLMDLLQAGRSRSSLFRAGESPPFRHLPAYLACRFFLS